jgi:signal transduction histidine kinase
LPLDLDRVNIREVIEELVEDLRPLAEEKGLELQLELPAQPVLVEVDAQMAVQIVRNLVINAVKFTSRGRIEVSLSEREGVVSFCVKDTGPGVQVAFEERLFQEFSRGPNSDGIEGTGLGLALSQRLARAMNGEVLLAENGPNGATFCWRTPIRCES